MDQRSFFSRWALVSGLLFVPAAYFAGAMVLADKAPASAASALALAPYAAALLLLGYAVKGRASWGSVRGALSAPLIGAGVAALVGIGFVSVTAF